MKSLLEPHAANHSRFCPFEAQNGDLVLAKAGVQHGEPFAAGVNLDVHREVTEFHLRAGGPQFPLIPELNVAVRSYPGQHAAVGCGGPPPPPQSPDWNTT